MLIFENLSGGKFQKPKEKRKKRNTDIETDTNVKTVTETTRSSPVITNHIVVASPKQRDDNDDDDDDEEFVFEIDDSSVDDDTCDGSQCQHIGAHHGMPPAVMTDNDNGDIGADDDHGNIEAAPHEVFASQIIIESLIDKNAEKNSTNETNLPEYRRKDLPDFMFGHEVGESPNVDMFGDTPLVLVGDDSSVCLPCQQTNDESEAGMLADQEHPPHNDVELTEEELAKIREEDKKET